MWNIFKRFRIAQADTTSKINLVNKTFVFKSEVGNPFITTYIEVLEVENGWVQYNFVHKGTGKSTFSPMSMKLDVFLSIYTEIQKPFTEI